MATEHEEQNQRLIRTISEVTIHSISSHDVDTISCGITSLEKIAVEFLQIREKFPEKFQIAGSGTFLEYDKSQNQYIAYISDELFRIFQISIDNRDTSTSKQVIQSYVRILDTALRQPDNVVVLQRLFDFRSYYGSLCWQMLDFAIDRNAKLEIAWLLHRLVMIPDLFLRDKRYRVEYVEEFISVHMFRIFQLIIDKNDFESFKELLECFSARTALANDSDIIQLLHTAFPRHNDKIPKLAEKILDILKYELKKDYRLTKESAFGRLTAELSNMKALLIKNELSRNESEERIETIRDKFIKLCIQKLIYSTFFAVGAYLIYKGEKYARWLAEIWYYTDPEYSRVTYVNELPIMREPLDVICFAMYEGIDFRGGTKIEFGRYTDATPYLHQYAVLSMLRDDKYLSFPSEEQIAEWGNNKHTIHTMFWYEMLELLNVDTLTDAANALTTEFTNAIRVKKHEIDLRIKKLNTNLEELKKIQQSRKAKVELAIDVSDELISTYVEHIKNYYEEKSLMKSLAKIYTNPDGEFIKRKVSVPTPRWRFIKQDFFGFDEADVGNIGIIDVEKYHLYETFSDKLQEQKSDFSIEQLKKTIRSMKNDGCHPNVIFVPRDTFIKIWKWQTGNLNIEGEELYPVIFRNNEKFKNIMIYDKEKLKVTYKDEVTIEVGERNQTDIVFTISVDMKVEILDPKAFVHLSPDT